MEEAVRLSTKRGLLKTAALVFALAPWAYALFYASAHFESGFGIEVESAQAIAFFVCPMMLGAMLWVLANSMRS
jgi:hypothetical protein